MDELAIPGPDVKSMDPRRSYVTWLDLFNHLNKDKKLIPQNANPLDFLKANSKLMTTLKPY